MFRTFSLIVLLATPLAFPALAQNGPPGAHFIENWDLNGDGQVDLAELTERRSDVFFTFDADENGTLDTQEYALFDEARANDMQSHGRGATARAASGMQMAFNDVNADGRVTREEFLNRAPDWFAMLDRNADTMVTIEDFGRK